MATSKAKQNVDYSVLAKTALTRIETLASDIDSVADKILECREKWRDYGAALLAQREQMDSDQKFGAWIKANGLDQGLARHHQVRSDAMWLAEQFASVRAFDTGNSYHPTEIRRQCKEAGFDWAGETEQTRKRKSQSRRTIAKKKKFSWIDIAYDEKLLNSQKTGGSTDKLKIILMRRFPTIDLHNAEHESVLRNACQMLLAEKQPEIVQTVIEEVRETVNESARIRFDKAIARITATLEGAYQKRLQDYTVEVQKGINERVELEVIAERQRLNDAVKRNDKEWQSFRLRSEGIKQVITKKEFQMLCNVLHPDRVPEDRRDRFAKAFAIMMKLQPYIEAFENKK